uniref:Uncharacterized protein n=1 Tax=Ditylenchus dipsaci TaxID=166011 RepID=A0A915DBU6_9BILA
MISSAIKLAADFLEDEPEIEKVDTDFSDEEAEQSVQEEEFKEVEEESQDPEQEETADCHFYSEDNPSRSLWIWNPS